MASKMNWGTGIVIAIIIFFILNGIVLYIAFGNKVDLVTENYYEKELVYQKEIDKLNNSSSLPEPVIIEYTGSVLKIDFPRLINTDNVTGKVHLYRPSDSARDKFYTLSPDTAGVQLIPVRGFQRGLWRVVIEWSHDGTEYLDKKDIFVN